MNKGNTNASIVRRSARFQTCSDFPTEKNVKEEVKKDCGRDDLKGLTSRPPTYLIPFTISNKNLVADRSMYPRSKTRFSHSQTGNARTIPPP